MKNYVLIIIILVLLILLGISYRTGLIATNNWKTAIANNKAYIAEADSVNNVNREFKMTISDLKYSKDTIVSNLRSIIKKNNIKYKSIKSIQSLNSTIVKNDTIIYKDTIFKSNIIDKDTVIGDNWYSIKIGISYPNTIRVCPSFISKKHIIFYNRRETVNPPKKFFLLRWFQKKQTITEITVVEENPYIQSNKNKFIEIVK
jgi:hypothetical protein